MCFLWAKFDRWTILLISFETWNDQRLFYVGAVASLTRYRFESNQAIRKFVDPSNAAVICMHCLWMSLFKNWRKFGRQFFISNKEVIGTQENHQNDNKKLYANSSSFYNTYMTQYWHHIVKNILVYAYIEWPRN
jgi:hypothetical protein